VIKWAHMNTRMVWMFAAVLLAGVILLYAASRVEAPTSNTANVSTDVSAAPAPAPLSTEMIETASGVRCYSTSGHFVIVRASPSVGDDVVIKYKTSPEQTYPCEYAYAPGDRELRATGPTYVSSVVPGFILFDTGTAPPPRGLSMYDLTQKKVVFADMYSKPTTVGDGHVGYWRAEKTPVTEENCPQLQEFTKNGLGAGIEAEVVLDVYTLQATPTGKTRCSARQ
jgi:hypothetical protein